ncbi:MAG: hypothetical protein AAGA27_01015 [Pseudomonadota bacterium]
MIRKFISILPLLAIVFVAGCHNSSSNSSGSESSQLSSQYEINMPQPVVENGTAVVSFDVKASQVSAANSALSSEQQTNQKSDSRSSLNATTAFTLKSIEFPSNANATFTITNGGSENACFDNNGGSGAALADGTSCQVVFHVKVPQQTENVVTSIIVSATNQQGSTVKLNVPIELKVVASGDSELPVGTVSESPKPFLTPGGTTTFVLTNASTTTAINNPSLALSSTLQGYVASSDQTVCGDSASVCGNTLAPEASCCLAFKLNSNTSTSTYLTENAAELANNNNDNDRDMTLGAANIQSPIYPTVNVSPTINGYFEYSLNGLPETSLTLSPGTSGTIKVVNVAGATISGFYLDVDQDFINNNFINPNADNACPISSSGGIELASGESCNIVYSIPQTNEQYYQGNITAHGTDANNKGSAILKVTVPSNEGYFVVAPTSLDNLIPGSKGTIKVTNKGGLTISNVYVAASSFEQFITSGSCPLTSADGIDLAAGESCSLSYLVPSDNTTNITGTINVNGTNAQSVVPISFNVSAEGHFLFSSSRSTFAPGDSGTIELKNTGATSITDISVLSGSLSQFIYCSGGNDCPTDICPNGSSTLIAGGSCTLSYKIPDDSSVALDSHIYANGTNADNSGLGFHYNVVSIGHLDISYSSSPVVLNPGDNGNITVTNDGGEPVDGFYVDTSDFGQFVVESKTTCPLSSSSSEELAVNKSCTVNFKIPSPNPTVLNDTYITANGMSGNDSTTVATKLPVTVVSNMGHFTISSSNNSFIFSSGDSSTITIKNDGGAPITDFKLDVGDIIPTFIKENTCTVDSLASGGSCVVYISIGKGNSGNNVPYTGYFTLTGTSAEDSLTKTQSVRVLRQVDTLLIANSSNIQRCNVDESGDLSSCATLHLDDYGFGSGSSRIAFSVVGAASRLLQVYANQLPSSSGVNWMSFDMDTQPPTLFPTGGGSIIATQSAITSISFNTIDGVNYVYYGQSGQTHLRWCKYNGNPSPEFESCQNTGSNIENPLGIAFYATTSGTTYAYIINGSDYITTCQVESDGQLTSCSGGYNQLNSARKIVIYPQKAISQPGTTAYAYIANYDGNNILKCEINKSSGQIDSSSGCSSAYSFIQNEEYPISITFPYEKNASYAYVLVKDTAANDDKIYKCTLSSNGDFGSCEDETPTNITISNTSADLLLF